MVDKYRSSIVVVLLVISLILLSSIPDLLRIISGFLILFFIPGFTIGLVIFPKGDISMIERLSISISLSISLSIIAVFILDYFFKIPLTVETVFIELLSMSIFFFLIYFSVRHRHHISTNPRHSHIEIISMIIVLVFIFNLVYSIHQNYKYPYHTDEWYNIAYSVHIIENKGITLKTPFFKEQPSQMDLEIGSHLFLAEFFITTGLDPVLFYRFMPAIFACITAFTLYVFVRGSAGNFFAGIFSILFFASLKSNISVLGNWFLVPVVMGFPLLYSVYYSLTIGLKMRKFSFFLSATIVLLALTLVHPSLASFVYLTVTLHMIIFITIHTLKAIKNNTISKKIKKKIIVSLGILLLYIIPMLSFIYFIKFLWQGSLIETIKFFVTEFMIFGRLVNATGIYKPFFLVDFYGFIAIFLAVIGILYVIIKQRAGILVSGLAVALGIMLLYQFHGFTILIFYERIFYCALLCLAPLSGIGLFVVLKSLWIISNKYKLNTLILIILSLTISSLTQYIVFSDYYQYRDKIYRLIDDNEYNAIIWLMENEGMHNVIMARTRISDTIYPISRNYVVSPVPHCQNLGSRTKDSQRFFMSRCAGKKEILDRYTVDYVLVKFNINCDYLAEIYNKDGVIIYKYNS